MTFQQMYIATAIIAFIVLFIMVAHTSPIGAIMMAFLFGMFGLGMLFQEKQEDRRL